MRGITSISSLIALAIASCWSSYAWGAEWGDLKMRFVLDGEVPNPAQLANEQLVINPANKGIANVVVFLRSDMTPPIHESYAATANSVVTLNNEARRFEPHMLVLRTKQTLRGV